MLTLIKGEAACRGRPRGGVIDRLPVVLISSIDVGSKLHQDLDHLHSHVFGGVVQRGLVQPGSIYFSAWGEKPISSGSGRVCQLCFMMTLACIQQHFDTVHVVVDTRHVQRGPIVKVIRLQTSIHCNQKLHTICIP